MQNMLIAESAVLHELDLIGCFTLVLGSCIVSPLAFSAGKSDIDSVHN